MTTNTPGAQNQPPAAASGCVHQQDAARLRDELRMLADFVGATGIYAYPRWSEMSAALLGVPTAPCGEQAGDIIRMLNEKFEDDEMYHVRGEGSKLGLYLTHAELTMLRVARARLEGRDG